MPRDPESRRVYNAQYYQRTKEKQLLQKALDREQNPEIYKARDARYRENNREQIRERDNTYYWQEHEKRLASANKSQNRPEYIEQRKVYLQEYAPKRASQRIREREKLLDAFGRKCVRCGYDADIRALQIDHVNGGGTAERRQFPNFQAYYAYILENVASGKYQVLCANCNVIKRMEEREHGKRPETT